MHIFWDNSNIIHICLSTYSWAINVTKPLMACMATSNLCCQVYDLSTKKRLVSWYLRSWNRCGQQNPGWNECLAGSPYIKSFKLFQCWELCRKFLQLVMWEVDRLCWNFLHEEHIVYAGLKVEVLIHKSNLCKLSYTTRSQTAYRWGLPPRSWHWPAACCCKARQEPANDFCSKPINHLTSCYEYCYV